MYRCVVHHTMYTTVYAKHSMDATIIIMVCCVLMCWLLVTMCFCAIEHRHWENPLKHVLFIIIIIISLSLFFFFFDGGAAAVAVLGFHLLAGAQNVNDSYIQPARIFFLNYILHSNQCARIIYIWLWCFLLISVKSWTKQQQQHKMWRYTHIYFFSFAIQNFIRLWEWVYIAYYSLILFTLSKRSIPSFFPRLLRLLHFFY